MEQHQRHRDSAIVCTCGRVMTNGDVLQNLNCGLEFGVSGDNANTLSPIIDENGFQLTQKALASNLNELCKQVENQ